MNVPGQQASWTTKVWQAVIVLLAAAFGARLVWLVLAPLLPVLLTAVVLLAVFGLARGRRRL